MEIGARLHNRYTLIARQGKGAMGMVYRAHDAQTGQEVALKVIAQDLAFEPDMLLRFRREGEALRQLRHPNIVGFVEMFEHEGQQVIVMEYVPGGSLHALIQKGPLPVERARRIALELCDALTRAHHIGIIHRDIKPENVLLAEDGTPKLTDFGVARLVSEGNRLTGTGTQVGTPYYMSPEAWEGKALDAQADIWSLGIVFFEMLAGQVPFSSETTVSLMNKVLTAPVPDVRSMRRDAPTGLAHIVARMTTRNKAERYQTMREVGADIERGDAVVIAPSPAAAQTRIAATPAQARTQVKAPQTASARLLRVAWVLARLGLVAAVGLAILAIAVVIGGAAVLGNVLENVVAGISFFPNEIGPGAAFAFSRQEVEDQINLQTAQVMPGTLRDIQLDFAPPDTFKVGGQVFGAATTLTFRVAVQNKQPLVFLERYDGLPLPIVGDLVAGGVNRGLARALAQRHVEVVSISLTESEIDLVLNGPGAETGVQGLCVSNQPYHDDFNADHKNWNSQQTALVKATYQDGAYLLAISSTQTILTQYLGACSFGDVQVTVDTAALNPDAYTEYGLIFGRQDAQNYYAFMVNTDHAYIVEKTENGAHQVVGNGWTYSYLLHTDATPNTLGVRVEGQHALFAINGQAVWSADLDAAVSGNVGLIAGSGKSYNAQASFDNFDIALPAEATPFPTPALASTPTATTEPSSVPPTATPTPAVPVAFVSFNTLTSCSPAAVRASLVIIDYGLSGSSTSDAADNLFGNTWGTLTVDGNAVDPATAEQVSAALKQGGGPLLDKHGRITTAHCDDHGCGYHTYGAIQLAKGSHVIRATWTRANGNTDQRQCTLTVAP